MSICFYILLLISNLSIVHGENVDYWVRPDTVGECPQIDPLDQCITITDMVTNSSILSAQFTRIHLLPGIHTPKVSGWIVVGDITGHSKVLNYVHAVEITGEINGCDKSITNCDVTIKCNSQKVGFIFASVQQLDISNINVFNCGTKVHSSFSVLLATSFMQKPSMFHADVSVLICDTQMITTDTMAIINSTGFGLLVTGSSVELEISILSTIIQQSNWSPEMRFHSSLGGNFLLIILSNGGYPLTHTAEIINSEFSYGIGSSSNVCSKQEICISGGLTVWINRTMTIQMNFENSTFRHNMAGEGAGIHISTLISTELSSSRVFIDQCKFYNNLGTNGAALYFKSIHDLELERNPGQIIKTLLRVTRSVFDNNAVNSSGGAMYVDIKLAIASTYSTRDMTYYDAKLLEVRYSKFINNIAGGKGGGLYLLIQSNIRSKYTTNDHYFEIKNNSFEGNKANTGAAIFLWITTSVNIRYKGLDILPDLSYFTHINIVYTDFISNTCNGDGAVYILDRTSNYMMGKGALINLHINSIFEFSHCLFLSNSARRGSAVAVVVPVTYLNTITFPIFDLSCVLSTFANNTSPEYNIPDTVGGSVIYLENIHSLQLEYVNITNNNCRAAHLVMSYVTIKGIVRIEHNTLTDSHGAGFHLDFRPSSNFHSSRIFLWDEFTMLYLVGNRATGYGGGIAITSGCDSDNDCFFSTTKEAKDFPLVIMRNNTAGIAGDSIYGGNIEDCTIKNKPLTTFWTIFDIGGRDTSSAVSSPPYKVCICDSDFPYNHHCLHHYSVDTYPGQTFQVPVVGVGQYNYSTPSVIHAQIISHTVAANLDEIWTTQNVDLECKNLSYLIRSFLSNTTVHLLLTVEKANLEYTSRPPIKISEIQVFIKQCSYGFAQDTETGTCVCNDYLAKSGVACNIENQTVHKTPSMWIGNFSGDILVHNNCPFDYCKKYVTVINPYDQQEQCDFQRSGVLCGGCRPGLSLVLGTSQCMECSNIYLLLLIPFALAGVALVVLLLKCNLTVSTGTINGLIFYVNIVQANRTAFFPPGLRSIPAYLLSVFIAWLNLDIGKEICFAENLNTYTRTWLQFVFPLYIWSLVGLLIFVSRYSITVSRLTGSNTVSVLATLFLLSYAKLLRAIFDSLSSTTITDQNSTVTKIWLLDGNYVFLDWPHVLLFLFALSILVLHILPFTLVVLLAPILQKNSHHKIISWVTKLNPLIDSYQGPYKIKFRYWTGLLLLVRLFLMLIFTANVSGNHAMNLLVIIITTCVLLLVWVKVGRIYKKKLPNVLELFFQGNLLIFAASSQYLRLIGSVNDSNQDNLVYCMVGSVFIVFICTIIYHCYSLLSRTKRGKRLNERVKSFLQRFKKNHEQDDEVAQLDVIAPPQARNVPTVTVVDLKEPLLQEDISRGNDS